MVGMDLRGTMSLVIASIISNKKQIVYGLQYLERGYEDIINKLKNINVKTRRKEQ
jgi:UDP-N-acetylglucosamine enolpyruvyl transferase